MKAVTVVLPGTLWQHGSSWASRIQQWISP